MAFQEGDRVTLASKYWVDREGDCDGDRNVSHLKVGHSGLIYTIEDAEVVLVRWDFETVNFRCNVACLKLENEVDDDELAEVLKSIGQTYQERKQRR